MICQIPDTQMSSWRKCVVLLAGSTGQSNQALSPLRHAQCQCFDADNLQTSDSACRRSESALRPAAANELTSFYHGRSALVEVSSCKSGGCSNHADSVACQLHSKHHPALPASLDLPDNNFGPARRNPAGSCW